MSRKTVYNNIVSDELYDQVSKENKELLSEFLEYLRSTDKSNTTIDSYAGDIRICYVWNLKNNNNKFFIDFTKRDIMRYQNYLLNELKLSSNRIRRLKAAISSMSNFIESMMDDLHIGFRNIVNRVPAPIKQPVREKTVLTEAQCNFLLDYLVNNKKYQQACAFALALGSGSRKAELLRFKVNYFIDENIKYGALYKTPEMIKTKGRGKGKMLYRYVLVSKFKPYFEMWMEERKRLGIEGEELFWVKYGGKLNPADTTTMDSWAESFSKILGIDFYWHSTRHFFTTELCKNNIPAEVIKNIIGWESVEMVSIYNDTEVDEELEKYFDENGIKEVEKKNISDIK
jgi:site-specific recombinase XerD